MVAHFTRNEGVAGSSPAGSFGNKGFEFLESSEESLVNHRFARLFLLFKNGDGMNFDCFSVIDKIPKMGFRTQNIVFQRTFYCVPFGGIRLSCDVVYRK